jgi:hypothetical protein
MKIVLKTLRGVGYDGLQKIIIKSDYGCEWIN